MTDADAVLDGIEVWAIGTMRVELADGKTVNAGNAGPGPRRVDRSTGRVELYVDEHGLDALTR